MRMIKRQLIDMFKNQAKSLGLLAILQVLTIFCILFVVGVLFNNFKAMNEDDFTTLYMYIDFSVGEPVTYREVEDVFTGVFDNFSVPVKEVSCNSYSYDEENDSMLGICTFFSWDNGKYKYSSSINREFTYQIKQGSGRLFSEEEMNSDEKICVTRGISDKEVVIDGITLQSVGELYTAYEDGSGLLLVTPPSMRDFTISNATINIFQLIEEKDYDYLNNALNKVVPGRYSIVWNREKDGERNMLLRTVIVTCLFMLIVMISVMVTLYNYIIRKNRYSLGVWRLLGCSHKKAAFIYTGEMASIIVPSLLFGTLLFIWVKNRFLINIYPYMRNLYTIGNLLIVYGTVFLSIIIVLFVVAYKKTDEKLRGLVV